MYLRHHAFSSEVDLASNGKLTLHKSTIVGWNSARKLGVALGISRGIEWRYVA
jgi:hypothetical protein